MNILNPRDTMESNDHFCGNKQTQHRDCISRSRHYDQAKTIKQHEETTVEVSSSNSDLASRIVAEEEQHIDTRIISAMVDTVTPAEEKQHIDQP